MMEKASKEEQIWMMEKAFDDANERKDFKI